MEQQLCAEIMGSACYYTRPRILLVRHTAACVRRTITKPIFVYLTSVCPSPVAPYVAAMDIVMAELAYVIVGTLVFSASTKHFISKNRVNRL